MNTDKAKEFLKKWNTQQGAMLLTKIPEEHFVNVAIAMTDFAEQEKKESFINGAREMREVYTKAGNGILPLPEYKEE